MLQFGSTSAASEQRDDIPTSSHSGYSLDGDVRDDHRHGYAPANGSFRTLVKSANATLQQSCNTLGSSIHHNFQQSSILESVGDKLSTLRNTTLPMNRNKDNQGIFATQSTSWGSVKENIGTFTATKMGSVKENISTIAATKVVQVAQNARNGFTGNRQTEEEVSFNYQLMSDE